MSERQYKDPVTYNLDLTVADTEYSYELPAGTIHIEVHALEGNDIRRAWVTGKVAGPTADYDTIPGNSSYIRDDLHPNAGLTLYLACGVTGETALIETWKEGV